VALTHRNGDALEQRRWHVTSHPKQLFLPQPLALKPVLKDLILELLLRSKSTRISCHCFLFLGIRRVIEEDCRSGTSSCSGVEMVILASLFWGGLGCSVSVAEQIAATFGHSTGMEKFRLSEVLPLAE
jgi:hypothetical protein